MGLPSQGGDWAPAYQQIHRRARLHAAQLPPDQLNPRGSYDARLRAVFSRFTRPRKGRDERSGYLPLSLPPPGAPWPALRGCAHPAAQAFPMAHEHGLYLRAHSICLPPVVVCAQRMLRALK